MVLTFSQIHSWFLIVQVVYDLYSVFSDSVTTCTYPLLRCLLLDRYGNLLSRMPTIKQVLQLIQQSDYAITVDLSSIGFPIPVEPCDCKVLPFRPAKAPRGFTLLTKPILCLCQCTSFHNLTHLHDISILIHFKCTGKREGYFHVPYWFVT